MNKPTNQVHYSYADDLGGLELLDAQFNDHTFSRHVHEGYCINIIESGAQRFYRSGANHVASQNSIVLVNADQVHDGHKAAENGWSYRAMYPTPDLLGDVSLELDGAKSDAPWFSQAVVCDAFMVNKLRELFTLLNQSSNLLERETFYLSTMLQLISRHAKQTKPLLKLASEPRVVKHMREFLDEHYVENISMQSLANSAELSPFYLARLFNKEVGLPPHAYQVQRRIQKAKQLLQSHQSNKLSDVATDCGFSDQSHLNRHFKRALGVTPGAYQRSCENMRKRFMSNFVQ